MTAVVFGALAGVFAHTSGALQAPLPTSHVDLAGSAAPEVDDPARPWPSVEAAARALPPEGGDVAIRPGAYPEAFVLADPARLVAPEGGVRIGAVGSVDAGTTSFTVFTWNTHLAGDQAFMPSWQDYSRAAQIGRLLAGTRSSIDLVSLCEVWDEDLLHGGDDASGIRPLSGYAHAIHGSRVDQQSEGCVIPLPPFVAPTPTAANSGLGMMSDLRLDDAVQISFHDCSGSCPTDTSPDCLASKGFIAATIVKDGFSVRVYNTHTQAGNGSSAVEARQNQIDQMASHITAYRMAHPSHVVLLMGDLNVIGESGQYPFLRDHFGGLGGRDAHRNTANVSMYRDPSVSHTLRSSNRLALKFDPHPYDQRLDYVWYFPSADGTVRVEPVHVERLMPHGVTLTEDDFSSDELSDHYPIQASFRLRRLQ